MADDVTISRAEYDALRAAVEAAKAAWENGTNENLDALEDALYALYADPPTPEEPA